MLLRFIFRTGKDTIAQTIHPGALRKHVKNIHQKGMKYEINLEILYIYSPILN